MSNAPHTVSLAQAIELGLEHHRAGRLLEAEKIYRQVLAAEPEHADALHLLGAVALQSGHYDAAIELARAALQHRPSDPQVFNTLGEAYRWSGEIEQALACYEEALRLDARYAAALTNRGNAFQLLQRYDEALASYNAALTLTPDLAEAHWNRSHLRLLMGDFKNGWKEYEWRFRLPAPHNESRTFTQPRWKPGHPLRGKTILLHAEQGLGDTLQFVRYAPAVAALGANVILEVQPALASLLSSVAGPLQVVAQGTPLPAFDLYFPLVSLPLAFDTRLNSIPAVTPYVAANAASIEKWRQRLDTTPSPRIGIAWSGNPRHINDRWRSTTLETLLPLLATGATIISLQQEVRPEDQVTLQQNGQIRHYGAALRDFSDTAALLSQMDLVVTVDTVIAHLAGAMGKPAFIMLPFAPDWRWLAGRADSPWYPTARLFRQARRADWNGVVAAVCDEVRQRIPNIRRV